jgi:branched-chain amino acid transport system substrate-binding protein
MQVRRRWLFGISAVTLVAVAAGCGSDDKATTTTQAAGTSAAAASSTAAGTATSTTGSAASTSAGGSTAPVASGPATGEPVKLVMILDESEAANLKQDNIRAGAEARVKRINAEGGLGGSGRPVEFSVCVTNLDPNTTLECARSAVADPDVIAVVGGTSSAADVTTVLQPAGMAMVATLPVQASDFNSPVSFELIGGVLTGLAGQGRLASQELKASKLTNLRVGLETAAGGTDLINGALATWGASPIVKSVDIPLGTADVSSQVATATQGADAVLLSVLPDQTSQIMTARQQQGITIPFLAGASNFSSVDQVKPLGSAGDGLRLVAYYPPDDADVPGLKQFLKDMDTDGKSNLSSDMAKNAWAGVDLIDHVAAKLPTVDRASLLAGLNATNDYDAGGMLPTIDFTKPGPNPAFPRIVNLTFIDAKIQDGKIVSVADKVEFLPAFKLS